ncbi:MAG TPA: hypothetical protein VLT47_11140 [Anaeromyxobacteraceae bacterium]|nr:hypothetical protein [Anaeromyxobacteraceae bacterium]
MSPTDKDRDAADERLVPRMPLPRRAEEQPIADEEARATVDRLGIDVPAWAADVRKRVAAAAGQRPPAVDVAAIEARCKAATPGPWIARPEDTESQGEAWHGEYRVFFPDGEDTNVLYMSDAAFIAHARTDVPALLAEVASLRARLDTAERERDEARLNALAAIEETCITYERETRWHATLVRRRKEVEAERDAAQAEAATLRERLAALTAPPEGLESAKAFVRRFGVGGDLGPESIVDDEVPKATIVRRRDEQHAPILAAERAARARAEASGRTWKAIARRLFRQRDDARWWSDTMANAGKAMTARAEKAEAEVARLRKAALRAHELLDLTKNARAVCGLSGLPIGAQEALDVLASALAAKERP